jgi:hypothetical protein
VWCSHVTTGRGGGGSSEEDLIAAMEEIWDDNKMWVDMRMTELTQRAALEEWLVMLLEEQCVVTSIMCQQLFPMWNWFVDEEE